MWENPHHIQSLILAVTCLIQKELMNNIFPQLFLVNIPVEKIKRENLYLKLTLGFIQICLEFSWFTETWNIHLLRIKK